jgi:hypothetical protein
MRSKESFDPRADGVVEGDQVVQVGDYFGLNIGKAHHVTPWGWPFFGADYFGGKLRSAKMPVTITVPPVHAGTKADVMPTAIRAPTRANFR